MVSVFGSVFLHCVLFNVFEAIEMTYFRDELVQLLLSAEVTQN